MKCPSSEEMAALYDGTLPRKFADPIRSHLAQCQRCAQDFKTLHQSLTQLDSAPPPPSRLINLIQEKSANPGPKRQGRVQRAHLTGQRPSRNARK